MVKAVAMAVPVAARGKAAITICLSMAGVQFKCLLGKLKTAFTLT